MPESLLFEPYVHLAGLSHDAALVSWGGFYFRHGHPGSTPRRDDPEYGDDWVVVDDDEFAQLKPERTDSIGERSASYGPAVVRLRREDGRLVREVQVADRNHVWLEGLDPDTAYRYEIVVSGKGWLAGERHDWHHRPDGRGLARARQPYSTQFRTHPAPDVAAPLTFAVLGDFGVGIRSDNDDAKRQHTLAQALERAVEEYGVRLVLTTGDNVYLGEGRTGEGGAEDDDWFFTFYQPYRYILSRIPFSPSVGNHDSAENERSDDRAQLEDNYFFRQRFGEGREAEQSAGEPGLLYRFRYGADVEFTCLDTTRAEEGAGRVFEAPAHARFLDASFPPGGEGPRWRIPFSHHPVFCAGPEHPNTSEMEAALVPRFEAAGVRLVLAGHEHNFQYSRHNGVHYVLSGAGGKLRPDPPTRFEPAHTVAWSVEGHFLIVQLDGTRARVHALSAGPGGELRPIGLQAVDGARVSLPLHIEA